METQELEEQKKPQTKVFKISEADRNNIVSWAMNNLLGKHAVVLREALSKLEELK